jgi:hypothetical protein
VRYASTTTISKITTDYAELDSDDERMLNMLMEYKEEHGDVHVPSGNTRFATLERERLGISWELASWVTQQRLLYRRAMIAKKSSAQLLTKQLQVKILVLESMGFLWAEREAQWQRSFNRLEAHKKRHGTLQIGKAENPQMYTWIDEQRKKHQKQKLSEERIALLEEIGFEFDLHEATWWDFYERLCRYKDEHGDTLVPSDYTRDPSLGKWVARQRRTHNHLHLSQERVEQLESLGFSWNVRDDAWDYFYDQLQEFYQENGHTRVPVSNKALWRWVERQRRFLRKVGNDHQLRFELEKMGLEEGEEGGSDNDGEDGDDDDDDDDDDESEDVLDGRIKRLEDLTVPAGVQDDIWMTNFRRLWNFKDQFGHFSVPYDDPAHSELSSWMRYQRYLHKRGRLPSDRVEVLEGIDFLWSARQARWDRMFEELVRFRAEHGHSKVPSKHGELYRWTMQQRKALESMILKEGNGKKKALDRRFLALEKILVD